MNELANVKLATQHVLYRAIKSNKGVKMRIILAGIACSLALFLQTADATPVVINTMPDVGDSTSTEQTFASNSWFDLASGFDVSTFGRVTHITAALTASASGPFFVGLASNEMIANPSSPTYFNPPPGSLWETQVCSTQGPPGNQFPPCHDQLGNSIPGVLTLSPGEIFDVSVDIFLPNSGTYWLYTRFERDDVFATWTKNQSIETTLVARRTGICAGPGTGCDIPADRTFFQVDVAEASPGLRIVYEPGLRVPEPTTGALLGLGALALVLTRSSRNSARHEPEKEF